jgi:hypothetical protein
MTWIPALLLAAVYAAELPLSIAQAGPNQVELRNTGSQAINAWAFAISSPNPSGGIHRVFHSADVYMSEVTSGVQGAATHLQRLMPGQSRAVPVDPIPADASLQVVALVFEDDTALGDEQTIATFFQKRAAERDELKTVVDIFRSVPSDKHGAAALQDLAERFAKGAGGTESVAHRSAREAVAAWQQKAASGASVDELDRSLQMYVTFVARQYDVAAKHAQRKPTR